jgi:hypothetical protein
MRLNIRPVIQVRLKAKGSAACHYCQKRDIGIYYAHSPKLSGLLTELLDKSASLQSINISNTLKEGIKQNIINDYISIIGS